MTSIKVRFRPSTVKGKEGAIFYQVIHKRMIRQLLTNYKILPCEWDKRKSFPIVTANGERYGKLVSIRDKIRWDMERLTKIINILSRRGVNFTADDIINEYHHFEEECLLSNFVRSLVSILKSRNRTRTAETYHAAMNSFRKFLKLVNEVTGEGELDDIMMDSINSQLIESYESYLRSRGNSANTTSFYMRILRAIYNRAVEDGLIEQRNPFRHVYTGVGKTIKRALQIREIKKIKEIDLSHYPRVEFARDMFLISFYLRGMSFIDMAFLRKTDLRNGYLCYRRRKTGQSLNIKWTKEMQAISDKYPNKLTPYLLPIITNPTAVERYSYRYKGVVINSGLKKLASLTGLNLSLTMYCARHSWATVAKTKGIPISVISEGMGHDSEMTTQIYLASLETSVVDRANSIVIASI